LTAGDQFRVEFGRGRPGDNRNVAEMAALAKRSLFASGSGSFLDMVNAESAKLANDVQISKTSLTAAELTRDEIAAKYAEKTGVNLDQEAGDLVRYQQAYQAAAQVLNTAKVLFDAILQIR
jgi:flagellar hook-associated protein 1 FlgK